MRRWEVGKVRIHQDGKMWRCASWRFHTWTLWRGDNLFTHTVLHTYSTPVHADILHIDSVTHGRFRHRRFYTPTLLHTNTFTYKHLYTHTQPLWHTNTFTHTAFTHRLMCTPPLLHTDAFTHRRFYSQTVSHTDHFTHRCLYTQTHLHTHTCDLLHPVPEN